jgi:gliding motility-associated-like protein
MIVNPIPAISPATFCEAVAPALLEAVPPGGVWSGPGVVNENTGLFDPSVAGVGSHTVSYQSPEGCGTQQTIVVTPFEEAVLEGLEDFYCFKDTILQPQLSPANGTLTIDGQPVTTINPADLGAGTHIITYTVGAGDCESSVTTGITVGEPIQIQLPFETDSICFNEGITLTATAFGGSSLNNFTYQWNQGLGFGQSHVVTPNFQTAYTVTAFDGCSDPATATLNVFVHPSFDAEFVTGDPVCFDDTTFAEVYAVPLGDYSYTWDSDPPTLGNYIESYPTSYEVEILDNTTGCWITREIDLPGYDLITANFSLSPNVECVTTIDPSIDILDFSVGALNGYWDFGDGNGVIPYQLGDDLSYTYRDTGLYTITLHIQNEGNCVSEFQQQICVKYANTLFAPNAFSPNGDGINDEFRFTGFGIDEIEWYVVNRYGELLYNGSSMDDGWDGFYRGNRVQQGVYTVIANYKVLGSGITRQFKGFVTVLH